MQLGLGINIPAVESSQAHRTSAVVVVATAGSTGAKPHLAALPLWQFVGLCLASGLSPMRCHVQDFRLTKSVTLAISRRTNRWVTKLVVHLKHDGLAGIGETSGFEAGHRKFKCNAIAEEPTESPPPSGGAGPPLPPGLRIRSESAVPPPQPDADCGPRLCSTGWGRWLDQPLWRLWGLDPKAGGRLAIQCHPRPGACGSGSGSSAAVVGPSCPQLASSSGW